MHCPQLTIGYGQTESTPVVTMSEVDDPLEVRVATVGKALPRTEMKIASLIDGTTLPVGEQGEVCARGYMVMKGYDDDPEATARAVDAEGWLHTGDLGLMRSDGYIHLTGRAKDMIHSWRRKTFIRVRSKSSSTHTLRLPRFRSSDCLTKGSERSCWLGSGCARAKTATESEIREFCHGKIAHLKISEHIRFVDAFPTTVTGKIQKFKIRQQEVQERGLQAVAQTPTA